MRYYLDHPEMQATTKVEDVTLTSEEQEAIRKLVYGDRKMLEATLLYMHELCELKGDDDNEEDCLYWSGLAGMLKITADYTIF